MNQSNAKLKSAATKSHAFFPAKNRLHELSERMGKD